MLTSFLFVRCALLTLFVPLDIWVSSKLMAFHGVSAIANQELLAFFLSPAGFLLSLWFITQLSFAFFVEHSTISILLAQHDLGKRSILDTFGLILQRSFRVAKVLLAQSLGISLLLSTLVWCGRWIYGLMLNDWDINYYLSHQMSSLWLAVGLLVLLTLPIVLLVLRYWASWWLALPLSLFQNCSQWKLFKQAQRLSQGIYLHILLGHIAWLLGRVVIIAIIAKGILFVLEPILHWATYDPERYPWIMVATVILIGVGFLLSFIDRFIYASCQYYVLRLQTKRLKLVNEEERFAGLMQSTQRRILLRSLMVLLIVFASVNGYSDVRHFVGHLQTNTSGYVTAHRGGGFAHPENSEAGIQYAISLGIESSEIDVQITKDGQVVVFHDRDLGRMLGSHLVVENASYAEIVAAYEQQNRIPPPLLTSLLDDYADDIEFNIELKRYNRSFDLALAMAELLPNYRQAMIVSSLDTELLARLMDKMEATRPEHLRYALIYAASVGQSDLERDVDMLMVSDQWLDAWRIIEIQQREQEVLAWTINNAESMQRLFLLGVDGIITDEPQLALETKESIEGMDFSERALRTLRHWLLF
ncbi:glycerophosphodiester phosphodiesterase family protein [Photobacterium rosenbergii]|uniref:Glycerophosphodiester phosphodiesterase family protein n=1 Tax=Photobacterium rosenbergii TaxID=294936 RepID=A0ABU3ZH60_9GAMM|nr:glycerophosphodiester phosphodiesterase family protein [Photobacterium rosenbergii]MDV5169254.1 glycerophosphodiester phosphodiesterase family protein [Photobacterium rosenbergii]